MLKIAFVLGVFGEELSWSRLPFIVLVAVLSSVGMSGVPGGGYIGEYIICSIFFPSQMELAFPILVAIGNLVDPPATMINSAAKMAPGAQGQEQNAGEQPSGEINSMMSNMGDMMAQLMQSPDRKSVV